MARGKYLSLEKAHNMGKLDQFAKEHPEGLNVGALGNNRIGMERWYDFLELGLSGKCRFNGHIKEQEILS